MGEASLSAVPKARMLIWLIVGIVTVVGLVLYFMYGDYVSPMLV